MISSLTHRVTLPCMLRSSPRNFRSPPANELRIKCVAAFLSPSKTHDPAERLGLPGKSWAGYGRSEIGGARGKSEGSCVLDMSGCVRWAR